MLHVLLALSANFPDNPRMSLVRSTLEYGAIIWDPYIQSDVTKMERIQIWAPRFITGDYKTRSPGSVTNKNLDLPLLQERRCELQGG